LWWYGIVEASAGKIDRPIGTWSCFVKLIILCVDVRNWSGMVCKTVKLLRRFQKGDGFGPQIASKVQKFVGCPNFAESNQTSALRKQEMWLIGTISVAWTNWKSIDR
jgi:hypothetical protein